MDCLFCKISSGEIPAYVIDQTPATIAILDVHPRSPGHAMVIPRRHSGSLEELPTALVGPVFEEVQKIARHLVKKLSATGLTIGINQGEVSGQTVQHLHIHLMPRFKGDGGGSVHSVVNNAPEETLEEMVEKLKITARDTNR